MLTFSVIIFILCNVIARAHEKEAPLESIYPLRHRLNVNDMVCKKDGMKIMDALNLKLAMVLRHAGEMKSKLQLPDTLVKDAIKYSDVSYAPKLWYPEPTESDIKKKSTVITAIDNSRIRKKIFIWKKSLSQQLEGTIEKIEFN